MNQQQMNNNGIDLKHVLYVFTRYKWLLVAIFVLGFAVAGLYLRYTKPVYEASMVIQLNDETETNFLQENNPSMMLNKGLARDLELLKSPVLLKRTLDTLDFEISYFINGYFIDYDVYNNICFNVQKLSFSDQLVNVPVFFTQIDNDSYALNYFLGNKEVEIKGVFNQVLENEDFSLILTKTNLNSNANKSIYFRINSPNYFLNLYSKNLSINVLNDYARTIQISLKDHNYERAKDVIEQLAIQFGVFNIENKQEGFNRVINYIDKTLALLKLQLFEIDSSLSVYRKSGIISALNSDEFLLAKNQKNNDMLTDFEYKKLEKGMELSLLNDVIQTMSENTTTGKEVADLIPLVTQIQVKGYTEQALVKLSSLLYKKQALDLKVTEQNKEYIDLKNQIDFEKSMLMKALEAAKAVIIKNIKEYDKLIANLNNELVVKSKDIPFEKELESGQLQRLFEVNSRYYEDLQQKKMEYLLLKESYTSNYRILQYPESQSSFVYPRVSVVLLGMLVACILISCMFILLAYFMHDTILTAEDIESKTNIPFLGEVSKSKDVMPFSKIVVRSKPKGKIAEEFRKIRYNLEFITNTKESKVFSLTSSVSGEGKTFVCLNLAEILSSVDNCKVLIIDADMRKPKIHLAFDVPNQIGLSTLLIHKTEIDTTVHKTENPSLDFISSGPTPPNPSELLMGSEMKKLLIELKKKYDYILIDNPPIGIVADAISTLKVADFPIYVFRAEYSKFKYLNILTSLKKNHKIEAMSIILNNVSNKHSAYGTYSKSYGYYEESGDFSVWGRIKKLMRLK